MKTKHAYRLAAALCLSSLVGCQSFDMGLSGSVPEFPKASPNNPVSEIVCLWEPAEGIGLDGLPTRGFAGQIMFFTAGSAAPVQVDGDIRIFLFDNHGTREEQSRPIHQFDFSGEAWNTYLHETNLGATYQVFIPYTRKGGYTADGVLRVRLTPEQGLPAFSKMSTIHLAGRRVPANEATGEDPGVSQAVNLQAGVPAHHGISDLQMPINGTDISSQQAASLTLHRGRQPNIRGLDAAISDLLRGADVETDEFEMPDEPPTGRYNLSTR